MRHLIIGLAAVALLASSSLDAHAQALEPFALDRFDPAPAGDRFFGVSGADPGGHGSLRAMVLADYAYRPLVLYANDGDDRVGSVVSDQFMLHAGLAAGLWHRLTLSVNVPFALVTEGDSPSSGGLAIDSPSGAALGDVRLGARLRLVGGVRGPAVLSIGGSVWLPTGDEERFAGDESVRGLPHAILSGEAGAFSYVANAGVMLRGRSRFVDTTVDDELSFGAGAALSFADRRLQIGPELYGTTALENGFERDNTNAEAILGAKLRAGPVIIGAGAGPGLTRGLGTPTLRAVASVTVAPEPEERAAPSDRDQDGILDRRDACPDDPGIASDQARFHGCPDRDRDGIFDLQDACPDVKGVESDDPRKNGCPPDRDGDGILDANDACPDVQGVRSNDPEKNGCPPDRDGDGILDVNDACPDLKGVESPDPEKNGCPPDTDGDGIRDDQDACPSEKGKPDPDPQKNGCPTLVRVTASEIVILQQVQFKTASDVILPESDALLEQVADVLREHPEIKRLEVQGHTDNRGAAAFNQRLSERRARSVMKWLVDRGQIDASRLEAKGYGMDQPVAENTTDAGRQQNRRVQFSILERAKPEPKPE